MFMLVDFTLSFKPLFTACLQELGVITLPVRDAEVRTDVVHASQELLSIEKNLQLNIYFVSKSTVPDNWAIEHPTNFMHSL